MSDLAAQALELAQWIRNVTAGKASDQITHVMVSELSEVEATLRDAADELATGRAKKRGKSKLRKTALTSRSKLNKRQDTAYLTFVRNHPCCSCSDTRDLEAHHTGKRGMGQRAPDATAVPLCLRCHRHFHDRGTFPNLSRANTNALVIETIATLQSEWSEREKG